MAEAYFAVTGPLVKVRSFENRMEAQSWSIPYIDAFGRQLQELGGGLLEPIQLYRIITPKDAMPLFLRTLMRGRTDNPVQSILKLPFFMLRKALGLKEIPDIGDVNVGPVLPVNTDNLQIAMIGYKEDESGIIPKTGTFQEKL